MRKDVENVIMVVDDQSGSVPAQGSQRKAEFGAATAATTQESGVRRKVLHFCLLQFVRIWTHMPQWVRRSRYGYAFGRLVHLGVREVFERQQYFATFFLRNRPELQLLCHLLDTKKPGSILSVAVLACSKGAEVYSIMWAIRSARPDLEVRMHALDISQEIVDFAARGVYLREASVEGSSSSPDSHRTSDLEKIGWNTNRDQGACMFERMTAEEIDEIFETDGDRLSVRPWLRTGIKWTRGDAGDPKIVSNLGHQDIVVANRFLCHMRPAAAEKCLRNIARLVAPGGYLFVSGIDLEVRMKVAQSLNWTPVLQLIQEIHDGDPSLTASWPLDYWALEPFRDERPDWRMRYASVFQIGKVY